MQKQEGTVQVDKNNKIINEGRGFTERSMNILLKKICDIECKEEAAARGISIADVPPAGEELIITTGQSAHEEPISNQFPQKKPCPLIKTMYIRDPSRSMFQVKKYNRQELEEDEEVKHEAYGDIKYDEFFDLKPEIEDELRRQHEEYLREEEEYERE